VAGSIILAGVLLKLGGYGLYRVAMKYMALMSTVSFRLIRLSLLGMTYVGFRCCRLNDMKSLVAYSSVAHMGLAICGLLRNRIWGITGAVILLVRHGLSSSGLFCFVNMVYERTGSRRVYINKGVLVYAPLFTLFIFLLSCSNISAPPTINFISEVILMIGVLQYETSMIIVFPLGSFLGVVFRFYLYSYTQHGKVYGAIRGLRCSNVNDYHLIILHLLPINVMVL